MRLQRLAWLAWLILGAAGGRAEITESVVIPLEWRPVEDYYKLGIWAGIGGGERALFEFDTGGAGFYAAYDASNPDHSRWWGTNFAQTGNTVTNTYQSGLQYTAEVVTTQVILYDKDGVAKVTSPDGVTVAMTSSIVNTNNNEITWPGTENPTDGAFKGDFGLSLKDGESGLLNILMQLDYAENVKKGFVVHVGSTLGAGDPYLRVGLTESDYGSFPILIDISGQKNDGGYKLALFDSLMTLTGGAEDYQATVGIALDTGNPTPGLHNPDDGVPASLIDGNLLASDQLLTLVTTQSNGSDFTTSFVTGTNYGVDQVYLVNSSNNFYLNVGMPFFQQYDVLFDFDRGLIGLRPLPEADTASMMVMGLCALWAGTLLLGRRRPRRAGRK